MGVTNHVQKRGEQCDFCIDTLDAVAACWIAIGAHLMRQLVVGHQMAAIERREEHRE